VVGSTGRTTRLPEIGRSAAITLVPALIVTFMASRASQDSVMGSSEVPEGGLAVKLANDGLGTTWTATLRVAVPLAPVAVSS